MDRSSSYSPLWPSCTETKNGTYKVYYRKLFAPNYAFHFHQLRPSWFSHFIISNAPLLKAQQKKNKKQNAFMWFSCFLCQFHCITFLLLISVSMFVKLSMWSLTKLFDILNIKLLEDAIMNITLWMRTSNQNFSSNNVWGIKNS